MVDSVEGLSADDIPDLLPSLPKGQTEGNLRIAGKQFYILQIRFHLIVIIFHELGFVRNI